MSDRRPIEAESRAPAQSALADKQGLDEVRALMLKLAAGQKFERLGAIVQEHLLSGGKQLRARLALSSIEALSGTREQAVAWAAACELLHNATLVHDDLQDGDELRRGQLTVWARHGRAQAINAGDLLLMLPFLAVEHVPVDAELKWKLARTVAQRAEETVRGQSLEMTLLMSGRLDWNSYAEAAIGKTSALLALPVHGAALIAGLSESRAERIADAFRQLGLLFQLQDDVLDGFGEKGRRQVGCDLREGSVSALVVEHLRLHPSDREWLVSVLRTPRHETSDREVEMVLRRFRRGGALDATLARILELESEILAAPALADEKGLHQVAVQIVGLTLDPIRHLFLRGADR